MRIHNFKIYTGYCEEQEITPVLMCHDEGFESPQEAMKSIGDILTKLSKKESCACDIKYKQFTYCGVCRKAVQAPEPNLFETWNIIRNGTLDSIGELYDAFRLEGWMLGDYNDSSLTEVSIYRFYSYLEYDSQYFINGAGYHMHYVD